MVVSRKTWERALATGKQKYVTSKETSNKKKIMNH